MERKIYERLLRWKREDAGSCAVLIDGARRVGKSWIAEEFARQEYRSHLLIDWSKAPKEVKELFWDYLEPDNLDTFFLKLSEHYGVQLFRRESLIIVVAQMLTAAGHELFFFSCNDSPTRKDWMEIDFLAAKPQISRRKNIIPLEVKSSRKYDHTSLDKFTTKYRSFLSTPIVFHVKDLAHKDGIVHLPLYMAGCL